MNRYLENGYKFEVEEKKGSFEIKETVGRGASCVVYRADFTDEKGILTEHILKEYNPKNIELFREETGELTVENEDDGEAFALGAECFASGYEKQLSIRRIAELKNATSNIQAIYRANGTQYIDMTCFNGQSYNKVKEKSLYDLLHRMKALTQVVSNYHKAGFLHLDIKPENIYAVPETAEFLMLFDFDSVVEKTGIGAKSVLSYTMSWAAPEQINRMHSKICEATDLFAVGEILFYQIMGRHSQTKERRSFGEYQFDYDSEIFENVNPKVYPLLSEVFRKTICTAVDKRFQSAEELLATLENIIALADPKAPFIKSSLPEPQSFFVGREKEIEEIHNRLNDNRILFVSGVGGIGKSELVKQYAKRYKNEYDAVIFAPYVSDMNMLIADDTAVPVYNLFKYPAEQPTEYIQRKWRKLKELCDESTLIIVDNLDRDDDPDLNKLLELGCKLLITTRVDFSDYGYEQLNVRTLADREEVNAIFDEYYKKPLDEKSKGFVDEIIDIVDGHTMTVELLAKQMTAGRITPEKMLSKLKEGGIGDSGKEKVLTSKDGVRSALRAYEHIRALFDVSGLSEDEIYILANLSLIPHTGVPTELFHDWCELDGYDDINELVHTGWIRCDKEKDFISLHPVIGDLAFDLLNERKIDPSNLMNALTSFAKNESLEESGFESLKEKADFLYKVSGKVMQIEKDFESAAEFLKVAPICFEGFTGYDRAILCYNKVVDICKNVYGNVDPDTAAAYCDLGNTCKDIGDLTEAEKHLKKALEIQEQVYDEENGDIAISYNVLGLIYTDMEDYENAEKCFNRSLEIRKKIYDADDESMATIYSNMASLYSNFGYYKEAEKYFVEALEIAEKFSDYDLSTIYNNLGALYHEQGETTEAKVYYDKSLEYCEKKYGRDHISTASLYNNLGALYKDLEKLTEAEEKYKKALDIFRKILGDEHSSTSTAFNNLGMLYHMRGIFELAEKNYVKSLETCKKIYGDKHTSTAISYSNLGSLYADSGKLEKAEKNAVKASEICEEVLGKDHKETAICYNNLGGIYYKLKKFTEAEKYCIKGLKIKKEEFGDNHDYTTDSYENLGAIYFEQKKFSEAEECYIKVLKKYEENFDDNHVDIEKICQKLALISMKSDDFKKAKVYCTKILDICQNAYGIDHTTTATAYGNLGTVYAKLGDFKNSEKCFSKALDIFKEKYGENHPTTETVYKNLQFACNKQQKERIHHNKNGKKKKGKKR